MVVKPYITFFSRAGDAELSTGVYRILTAMEGNANYPEPSPSLPVVTAAWNEFKTALANAADGGMTLTLAKNARRATLVALMRQLAIYVQAACNGDLEVLLTSGFPVHKPKREPRGRLEAPKNLMVTLGARSGELRAMVTPDAGASIYNWRLSREAEPTVVLQLMQSTTAKATFTGLTPGVVYRAEANAVGAAGPSGWTNPVSQMVI